MTQDKRGCIQFIKFGLVGFINTIISYSIYSAFVYLGFHYLVGSIAGFVISVFTSFLLNSKFVFKEKDDKEKRIWWKVLTKTYVSYGFSGLLINSLLLILWISVINISQYINFAVEILAKADIVRTNTELAKYLAPLINLLVTIPLNFLLNKFWAYSQVRRTKMNNIKLLDCTLRDGGYVNDWEFGYDNIINVFERLISAGIDIVEVGFLDDRRIFDINRTIMPDCNAVNKIYGGLDKEKSLIVGMIDYGTCGIENILPCNECFLDGIRIIFKKEIMHQAISFCRQVKDLGYKIFVQAVSITSYCDDEMMELLELVNDLKPYAFSLVDTYGLLYNKQELVHYYNLTDKYMNNSIGLGYHSHNNFQLAYANCVELLESPPENRIFLVDGTLYGMGKSAGNAPLELLAMYMNEHLNKNYNLGQILEAIDVTILEIYRKIPWGYNFKFFMSASNDCHPNYVTYLMDKKTLSIKSINEILSGIESDKKLLYDKACIETLYLNYQKRDCNDEDDIKKLTQAFEGQRILMLGSGNTIETERETILKYIEKYEPIVIAVNFLPVYDVNYIFISNSRRYVQLSSRISKLDSHIKLIATSNVTKSNGKFDFTFEYSALLDEKALFVDNSMIMLLKLLKICNVNNIALAGFDGYSKALTSDYANPNMAYSFSKEKAFEINNDAITSLKRLSDSVKFNFITKSHYIEEIQ